MLQTNSQSFKSDVLDFQGLVLVDFWADWCAPCRALTPILQEISESMVSRSDFKIAKLNTDENQEIAQIFNIRGIPNMKFFKNGKLVGELVGLLPKDVIVQKINDLLKAE